MKKAGDIMSKKLFTVTKDHTLEDAAKIMTENDVSHILVVNEEGALIGILSDRDTKKLISPFVGSGRETPQDKATLHIKIEKVMHKDLLTVTVEDTIKTCIERMLQRSVHSVPVVDDQTKMHLKGIVTSTNIFKWILAEV